ncbi:hypothetical protein PAXRUDRAFT_447525 [Paxillus rubicundulus Ve08.2h10]|uniref:Uncharacterized protein n=1 Tax=Paxillus rubicundulus Ve08.2h10 TaxID=930991 RepID=A0A0D0DWY4_9AGAM|nr:hypothetical protein PAXRUDRAFT_447525 [Paxillus rubicundulus Ve08.2h10]
MLREPATFTSAGSVITMGRERDNVISRHTRVPYPLTSNRRVGRQGSDTPQLKLTKGAEITVSSGQGHCRFDDFRAALRNSISRYVNSTVVLLSCTRLPTDQDDFSISIFKTLGRSGARDQEAEIKGPAR